MRPNIAMVGLLIAALAFFFDVLGFFADPQKVCFYKIPWVSNFKDCVPKEDLPVKKPIKNPILPFVP